MNGWRDASQVNIVEVEAPVLEAEACPISLQQHPQPIWVEPWWTLSLVVQNNLRQVEIPIRNNLLLSPRLSRAPFLVD